MKIVVPFALPAHYLPAVRLALVQDGWEAEYVHCTRDTSYYQLLVDAWPGEEDLCVVEHDIIVWPGALQQLANCPQPWCTIPYYCSVGWIRDGLGVAKFAAPFRRQYPEFLREPFPACCQHTSYYCGLDRLIAHRMTELGISPHVHQPGVVNLNEKWT